MVRGFIGCIFAVFLTTGSTFAQQTSTDARNSSSAPTQEPGDTKRTRLMLGIDLKQTTTLGVHTSNKLGLGFMWRWRGRIPLTDDRLVFSYRLGSYSTRVSSPVAGEIVEMGPARFRPLMIGADYRMPRGKWTWSAGVTAGWSLNTLDTSAHFRERFANGMRSEDVVTDIDNSFAWSPRFRGWYDVNRRVSFLVEAYYAHNRPEITIRSGGVDLSRRLNADALVFKTGLVYGVW